MSSTMSSSASFSLKILTALIGSPTYLGFLKPTVFTSPPRCTSKQGMMRGRSTSDLRKVAQQARAAVMTLLRVELDAVEVPGAHGARKLDAVAHARLDVLRIRALEVVGM